ncbi:6-carboxytetrahydropterin synthase [Acidicapsa ligni]|uniref:6-carboxytetrahydropterin synthase n=1 Tax=Acidicapsa ligni TaxID=542300 RepID=UPI0021DF9066|nr:6-carboxytetrahydropterin synthase [Acidicapsa ligni]
MKAYFSRRYRISASHRLHSEALSPEENRAVFGKCNNPHGHGHNYKIEATVGGEVDANTGMVINMVTLDSVMKEQVLDRFDHKNLNDDPLFAEQVSTTENFCIAVYELLQKQLLPAILKNVRIEETENNFFEYSGK